MRCLVFPLLMVLALLQAESASGHSDRHVARPGQQWLEQQRLEQQWLREFERIKALQRRRGRFILDVF